MSQIAQQEIPTRGMRLRFAWALMWRSLLVSLILSFFAGMLVGFIGAMLGIPKNFVQIVAPVLGMLVGFSVYLWAVGKALKLEYSGYRIQFVKTSDTGTNAF